MKRILLFLVIILFISSCSSKKKEFELAYKEDTVEAYESFMQKYPNSEFCDEAKGRIKFLKFEPIPSLTREEMRDEDKLITWKNERIKLLPSRYGYPYDYFGEALAHGDGTYEFHKYGNPSRGILYRKYAGKTGKIISITKDKKLVIKLDGSGEKIMAGASSIYLGFFSELEIAKSYIGKILWSKGPKELYKEYRDDIPEYQWQSFEIKNIKKVIPTRAEWGDDDLSILLYLQAESGEEGFLKYTDYFDNRFLFLYTRGPEALENTYIDAFYQQDPKQMHREWKDKIWELIENSTVAIGMTEEMALMACGGEFKKEGAVISTEKGSSQFGKICSCGDYKFLIEDGIVKQYVE